MYAGLIAMVIAAIALLIPIFIGVEGDAPMTDEDIASTPLVPAIRVLPEYETDAMEWATYWHEAFAEYEDEFTALFNSYETKWSKNNRLMMKKSDEKSFKFVAKGK